MARRPSSVCPSVCNLLRKSLLLPGKWPDRHQTFTRWTPSQRASRVCSRSRSRSKVTWYANFLGMSYSVIDGVVKQISTNVLKASSSSSCDRINVVQAHSSASGVWTTLQSQCDAYCQCQKVRENRYVFIKSAERCVGRRWLDIDL